VWARALVVVVVIAGVETLHGIARTMWVTPRLGDLRARQLGVLTGSLLILAIATITIRWLGPRTIRQKLTIGALWLVSMLAFEAGLGWALGASWSRLAADYDPAQGGFMLFGMAILLLAPTIDGHIRDPLPPPFG
jgi:hypothetical protein